MYALVVVVVEVYVVRQATIINIADHIPPRKTVKLAIFRFCVAMDNRGWWWWLFFFFFVCVGRPIFVAERVEILLCFVCFFCERFC